MELDRIVAEAHASLLAARQLDRIVSSREFEEAYNKAKPDELVVLSLILKSKDLDDLRHWMRSRLYTVLEDMPYGQLRELASNEQIPKYSRMSKQELIIALEAKRAASVGKCLDALDRNEALIAGIWNPRAPDRNAERPPARSD